MDSLPPPTLPDNAIDTDLQMRLGRNLLVFQRIETNLKRLMSSNRLEFNIPPKNHIKTVDPNVLLSRIKRRAKQREEQTLGPLRNAYLAEILGMEPTTDQSASDASSFRLDVKIDLPESDKAIVVESINAVIKDRNEMMHNLLPRLGKGESENLASAKQWLDEVHQRSIKFLDILRVQMHVLSEGRAAMIESMQSEDFWRLLESNTPTSS